MSDESIELRPVTQFESPEETLGSLDAQTAGNLIAAAADVTLIVDEAGIIRDVAYGSDELSRAGQGSWIGQSWADTVTEESRAKVAALLEHNDTESGSRWRQVNHRNERGDDIPLLYSAIRVNNGQAPGAVAFGRDLRPTAALQQRLVEAQIAMERDYARFRHAETRYRHLFKVTSEAVIILDAESQKIAEFNPAAATLFGAEGGHLMGAVFPVGFSLQSAGPIHDLLSRVRAGGESGEVEVELANGTAPVRVAISQFRHEGRAYLLVRVWPHHSGVPAPAADLEHAELLRLAAESVPDSIVVTDMEGRILAANDAFLDLVGVAGVDLVLGRFLSRWLGRTGVDMNVLLSNLKQRGLIRMFATGVLGEAEVPTEVEISARLIQENGNSRLAFVLRDVGLRLQGPGTGGNRLPQSASQLKELVGRVPLRDIVGQTTDLIEQLCIEAALELTRDNRALAAEILGLSRQGLYVKLRRYGINDLSPDSDGK